MADSADPLNGYKLADILNIRAGPATNDVYGKLYVHVRENLRAFRRRLVFQEIDFTFSNIDATALRRRQSIPTFDRIEVRTYGSYSRLPWMLTSF